MDPDSVVKPMTVGSKVTITPLPRCLPAPSIVGNPVDPVTPRNALKTPSVIQWQPHQSRPFAILNSYEGTTVGLDLSSWRTNAMIRCPTSSAI